MTEKSGEVTFEADLDATPEAIWRAISEPALREEWLGEAGEVVESRPPEVLVLRVGQEAPSGLVIFRVGLLEEGGSRFSIVHRCELPKIVSVNDGRRPPVQRGWRMAA